MYDVSDPRARLAQSTTATAPAMPPAAGFAAAQFGRFYESEPQERGPAGRTWYTRGQNFIVAYSDAAAGAVFARQDQRDEYVVLVQDRETSITVTAGRETVSVPGHSLVIVPPGNSQVAVPSGGRIVRLFSTQSKDLADKCENAAAYATRPANIPPFQAVAGAGRRLSHPRLQSRRRADARSLRPHLPLYDLHGERARSADGAA